MASPRPEPSEPGPRTKRPNTLGSRSGGMPVPVSVTSISTMSPASRALTVTVPRAGVCLMALESRFASTLPRRAGSASTAGTSSTICSRSATPAASALGRKDSSVWLTSTARSTDSLASERLADSVSESVRRSSTSVSRDRVAPRMGARWAASPG